MTVKELIAELQKLPEEQQDLPVLFDDNELGALELNFVGLDSHALQTMEQIEHREKVMAFHNGEEIMVEVPKFHVKWNYLPGVVLS
jgi:hypothetical protein